MNDAMHDATCAHYREHGVLQCYVDGEINEADYVVVVAHLGGCSACRVEVTGFVALKRVLRRQRRADPEVVSRLCSFAALLTRDMR